MLKYDTQNKFMKHQMNNLDIVPKNKTKKKTLTVRQNKKVEASNTDLYIVRTNFQTKLPCHSLLLETAHIQYKYGHSNSNQIAYFFLWISKWPPFSAYFAQGSKIKSIKSAILSRCSN